MKYCPNCGEEIANTTEFCTRCGTKVTQNRDVSDPEVIVPVQSSEQDPTVSSTTHHEPKYRIVAALLALFFGTFGVHKFYMNKTKSGILHIVFLWTGAPTVIGLIEAILYLTDDKEMFHQRMQKILPKYPARDRLVAAALGILGFGGFGAHHFFLKNPRGKYHLMFFWTGIPFIVGFVQGIIYLLEPLENFTQRYYY